MKTVLTALAITMLSTSALADCVLKQVTSSQQTGTIESVEQIQSFTTAWTDNTRKCNVDFNALVAGKWHKGFGAYTFGNDEREQESCAKAFKQGKKDLLAKLYPQSIQSEDVLICSDAENKVPRTGLEGLTRNENKEEFQFKGAQCGWYFQTVQETYGLYQWTIIACELKPNKWTIVDKF